MMSYRIFTVFPGRLLHPAVNGPIHIYLTQFFGHYGLLVSPRSTIRVSYENKNHIQGYRFCLFLDVLFAILKSVSYFGLR